MKNYYAILELSPDASAQDIKKAFRRLAKKYHPDKNPDFINTEGKFAEICKAHEILTDINARKNYDKHMAYSKVNTSHNPRNFDHSVGREERARENKAIWLLTFKILIVIFGCGMLMQLCKVDDRSGEIDKNSINGYNVFKPKK